MYLRNYGLRKRRLDKCLKSHVSEDPSTSNMEDVSNTVPMWTTAALPYLLITLNIIHLEKVYITAIQNLKTVCSHIHCR